MAITAMGLGTKAAPEGANLDPQREFWSWLGPFVNPDEKGADNQHHERGYFSGFACTQTDPAGMSIKIGGGSTADSALLVLTDGRCVLLSTNGEPEAVTIPTAPATGSRIDAVVSYIDTTSPVTDSETPGTPEYVHTIVVSGTASSNPSAPTDDQIVGALPAGANSKYYRWCDVRVAASQTVITNSDITDKKPASPDVYSASKILDTGWQPLTFSSDVKETAWFNSGARVIDNILFVRCGCVVNKTGWITMATLPTQFTAGGRTFTISHTEVDTIGRGSPDNRQYQTVSANQTTIKCLNAYKGDCMVCYSTPVSITFIG